MNRILDWDSAFFGHKIATTDLHRLTDPDAHELICWCYEQGVDCLYFLADSDDQETMAVAENYHFQLTDVRVTLGRDLTKKTDDLVYASNVRLVRPEDIPILRDLVTFDDSRFYYDAYLRDKAPELFKIWIEKSCDGYADAVFVCELEGQIAGYVTVKGPEIILMAAKVKRQGVASTLCRHALRYLKDHGVEQMTVVTQGRNIATQAMYQRNGLVTVKTQLWYNWWSR
jgi:GNAT superfamily N-acetyltransferase